MGRRQQAGQCLEKARGKKYEEAIRALLTLDLTRADFLHPNTGFPRHEPGEETMIAARICAAGIFRTSREYFTALPERYAVVAG